MSEIARHEEGAPRRLNPPRHTPYFEFHELLNAPVQYEQHIRGYIAKELAARSQYESFLAGTHQEMNEQIVREAGYISEQEIRRQIEKAVKDVDDRVNAALSAEEWKIKKSANDREMKWFFALVLVGVILGILCGRYFAGRI